MTVRSTPELVTFTAGEDLTGKQYHAVKLDSSNENEILLSGAGDESIGILCSEGIQGSDVSVVNGGGSYAVIGTGAIVPGDKLKPDAAGKLIISSPAEGVREHFVAIAIGSTSSADAQIEVLVMPQFNTNPVPSPA